MKARAPVIIGIVVLIAALLVVVWLWQRSREVPAEEQIEEPKGLGAEILEKTQAAQNKVESPVPETNPFQKTNPFKDAYKNPFQ